MQQVLAVARSALGAICVVGIDGRIRYGNAEAERLLGIPAASLIDASCRSVFGEDCVCGDALERALAGEVVEPFDLHLVRPESAGTVLVAIPLAVRDTEDGAVVLTLFPRRSDGAKVPATLGEPPLTARELEVLRYLLDGCDTETVAQAMSITRTTVRNHVQRLLRKLGAHSKIEAVAIASRAGLRGMARE